MHLCVQRCASVLSLDGSALQQNCVCVLCVYVHVHVYLYLCGNPCCVYIHGWVCEWSDILT